MELSSGIVLFTDELTMDGDRTYLDGWASVNPSVVWDLGIQENLVSFKLFLARLHGFCWMLVGCELIR